MNTFLIEVCVNILNGCITLGGFPALENKSLFISFYLRDLFAQNSLQLNKLAGLDVLQFSVSAFGLLQYSALVIRKSVSFVDYMPIQEFSEC